MKAARQTGLVKNAIIGSFIQAKTGIQYGKIKNNRKKRGTDYEF